ncbi:MAG TPA: hypothetical protein VJN63_05595 [Thermoplasmata archaeon]|nr:hypothetical protein [Thermoplasmata archaeon]
MKQATLLIGIIVLMAIGLGFVVGSPFLTLIGGVDVDFKSYEAKDHWAGVACGGNNPTRSADGLLLDQKEYIASWSPNLIGQRVTIAGGIQWLDRFLRISYVDKLRVQLTIDLMDGKGEQVVLDTEVAASTAFTVPLARTTFCYPTSYWDIVSPDGKTVIPEGSVLHASWWYHEFIDAWYLVGEQRSVLHTGIGILNRNQDQVTVGETACFTWHVGYVSDPVTKRGWSAHVVSGAQGYKTVAGPQVLTDTDGQVCYKTSDADFSSATPNNELRAFLKNELWDKSFDITTTITAALKAFAPTCTIKGTSPQSPRQGDQVTVSFECKPASAKAEDRIKLIKVLYGWGGIDQEAQVGPTDTSYSFVAAQSGYVRWEVIAYTNGNVPSGTKSVDIQIEHQKSREFITDTIPWALIAAAVVFILGLLFILPKAKDTKIFLLLLIFLGIIASAAYYGVQRYV